MSDCSCNSKALAHIWDEVNAEYKSRYVWDDPQNVLFCKSSRHRSLKIACQYRYINAELDQTLKWDLHHSARFDSSKILPLDVSIMPLKPPRLPKNFCYQCVAQELTYTAKDIIFRLWALCGSGLENELANMIIFFCYLRFPSINNP